ncbi:MAG: NUDIX hydrolase [Novosphingobium sp.]|nr:NUDIX hydrolase [Novosphingobium sp.]
MPTHDDRITATETLHRGWMNVLRVQAHLGGEDVSRILVEHPSGAAVLAYDPERKVAMTVRQTRLPLLHSGQSPLDEAVVGVTEDEPPEQTAIRECREETGIRLHEVELVGHVWMTTSSTTERVHLFLGRYTSADRLGPGGGADGEIEELELAERPLSDLWACAASGALMDSKLFMLLQALRIRRPELF